MMLTHSYNFHSSSPLNRVRERHTNSLARNSELQSELILTNANRNATIASTSERNRGSIRPHRTIGVLSITHSPRHHLSSPSHPISFTHRNRSSSLDPASLINQQSSQPHTQITTSNPNPATAIQSEESIPSIPPTPLLSYPLLTVDPTSVATLIMSSRPTSARPTHIPMPSNNNFSPTGTPLATPPIGTAVAASPASPRHSFLGFMRTRGRSNTLNNVNQQSQQSPASPSFDRSSNLNTATGTAPTSRGGSSREGSTGPVSRDTVNTNNATINSVTRSISTPLSGGGLNISTNTNSNSNSNSNGNSNGDLPQSNRQPRVPSSSSNADSNPTTANAASSASTVPAKTYRIRLVPHLESTRSLAFDPVIRELLPIVVPLGVSPAIAAQSVTAVGPTVNGRPPALILKVGRFTDKSSTQQPAQGESISTSNAINPNPTNGVPTYGPTLIIAGGGGDLNSNKVAFKSKVVSRGHAEIWCEDGGKFYIRDTSSSSGTFLNHIRLSSPNTDSRPTMLNDGDILQLGVDYQGGTEEMFRCVKIRVEIGREWQRGANEFNTNALKQLKALGGVPETTKSTGTPSKKAKASVTDCCICLFSVTVCQSLFIAPCSHVFHYKCIRPLLLQHHPGFSCPLCRTFANLEEDVETEDAWEIASRRASIISRKPSNHSIRLPASSQNDVGPPTSPAGPSGQPSTNIGLGGANSASVNDLLSNEVDLERGAEESEGMNGSFPLARQTTAVGSGQDQEHGQAEMEVPEMVQEEPEPESNNPFQNRGSEPVPIARLALNDQEDNNSNENGFNDAATPMNEHFLSTLAIGNNVGIAQRLELADEIVNTPTTSTGGRSSLDNSVESGNEVRNGMYT
ncbi:uncharacterized protein L201_005404 [Kwoniella dendrophila CBS 6074]|uniref:Cytoplasmic protein n=1 Tax=Kwoniella dendrophila CBS 6074 TaxID=1295534 RepID=A0AAX4K080_9TREE